MKISNHDLVNNLNQGLLINKGLLPAEDEVVLLKEKVDKKLSISNKEFDKLVGVLLYHNDIAKKQETCLILGNIALSISPLPEYVILGLDKSLSQQELIWQISNALQRAVWFQKQVLPFTTLEKLASLLNNDRSDSYARKCISSTLEHAINNGQKIWESRIILESLKKASLDSNKEIANNALRALSNIVDRSKNIVEIKETTYLKEVSSFYHQQSFSDLYKSFNGELVAGKIKVAYSLEKSFHLQVSNELRYVTRKHPVIHEYLTLVCDDIIRQDIDYKTKVSLAQIIKYSVRKGGNVEFNPLINILETSDNDDVKSEIIYALGYKIKNSRELVEKKIIEEIKGFINEDIKSDAKSFLDIQIQKQLDIINGNSWKISYGKIKVSTNYSRKGPAAVVTKTQQKVKVSYKNSQSEEATINILNLADALKNRNKKIKINSNAENLPEIKKNSKGSDRSWFGGTYTDVKSLYGLAKNGKVIKDEDKDKYLLNKFMGYWKWHTGGLLGSLLTDRMIAATFNIISKTQNLNEATINKLIDCLGSLKSISTKFIDDIDKVSLTIKMFDSWKPTEPNLIEKTSVNSITLISKNFFSTFSYTHDCDDDSPCNCYSRALRQALENKPNVLKEIENISLNEVNQIRLDAISAIYNCALRDRKILTPTRLKTVESCLEDKDTKFKGFVIKILGTLVDSKEINYQKLFYACLEQLESNFELEQSIGYINQQTKDLKRCKELFDDKTILRLSKLLKHNSLDNQTKIYCCEIINNYLEHTFSKGLNNEELKNCKDIIENTGTSNELKTEVLRSILLTAEKAKDLPEQIVNSLVNNIDSLDEKTANFVVITLGKICEKTPVINLDKLSSKLLDDQVVVDERGDITFEQRSKDNLASPSISSIVSKTFVESLQKGGKITEKGFDHLVSALDSNDKQTRILSAKALSIVASHNVISDSVLTNIREYVEDKIADVSTYTILAYTEGLNKLVQNKVSIFPSHIEFLSKVYAFENLRLGEQDFTKQVNDNILSVLLYEADKQKFDESVFSIFDHILFANEDNQRKAVKILDKYTSSKYLIPTNTIAALENALGIPEVCNMALKVLENVIQNGQRVSERTLHIFSDNLYLAEDADLRLKSFKLLDIADDNQDLSDEVFDKLELQRAGSVIANHLIDKEEAIFYLKIKADEGQKLPIDTLKALTSELTNKQALSILSNISKNKQVIPDYLIDKLILEFDPKQTHNQIIEIFASIAKNNQNIPSKLLVKLEKALDNELISDQVLSIFALQGQKGEKLSENVISRICNKFLTINSEPVKQELLSAISSIIEQNSFDRHLIKKVLIHGITQENKNIIESSINGFRSFAKYIELDEECINTLVKKAARANSDESIKKSIYSILDSCKLDGAQKNKLELANLDVNTGSKFLDKISKLLKQSPLLEQNFKQLNFIIDNEPDLQFKVINILIECLNKEDISDELMNSVAILSASTKSNEIKRSCYHLVNQIAATGRKLNDKIISLLVGEESRELAQSTLELVARNQEISFQASLSLRIDSIKPSISTKDLNKLLQDIHQELRKGFELTDSAIQKLLMIQFFKQESEDYSNIFAYILAKQPKYCSNKTIVSVIEQGILSKKVSSDIINRYNKIIRERSYLNLDKVIDTLADLLQEGNETEKLNLAMLGCISSAAEVAKISEKCLSVLESNIDSFDENIRSLSFRGLRAAQDKGYKSEIFKIWCNNVIGNLELSVSTEVKPDLELLDTLASLKYIDFNKLAQKPQIEWKRELLLSDLLARFKVSEGEKFTFYKNWLDIEQSKQFQIGKSEEILKALRSSQNNDNISFVQLNDIVRFLSKINFETANNILLNSTNRYTNLKQKWIERLLLEHLNQEVSNSYLEKLAFNICNKFTIAVVDKLLNSISVIGNLREFELLLDFAEINQIKTSDIYIKNASVNELKRSLEIKILGNQIQVSVDRYKLANTLDNLLDRGWSFEQLKAIFINLKSLNTIERVFKEQSLISIIEILDQYKISQTNHEKVLTVLSYSPEDWLKEINKIAVENNFQAIGKVKNSTELVEELKNRNLSNKSISKLIDTNLLSLIEQIKNTKLESRIDLNSDLVSKISNEILDLGIETIGVNTKSLKRSGLIIEWDKSDIGLWSSIVKSNPDYFLNPNFLIEALAVIKRANFLETGFHMTDSQILSCLVALHANQDQGRLLQVATGEGKSTIVSVLAIINGLKGKKVDIITSSPVLAERDAKEKAGLYKIFGLSCADNNDKSVYIKGAKDCYKKDIVYGEAAQFQFDSLRDEYSLLGTLANRKCEVAIVDEVDSMLIDDSSKIARLSSTIAGMDQLQPIYHFLWQRLLSMQEKVVEIDGKMCLLYGKISYDQDKIILEYADEKGELIQVSDLKNYVKSTKDISHIGQFIEGEIEVFLKKHLEDYIKELFDKNVIKIPGNFKEFIEKQTSKWINNAIVAFNYQENVHYVIHEGIIKPVDYNSTGIVQSSTNWSDGLHQFLQIKHALKMTSETFTTNFLSNMGYFKRYGSNLFGLTGTLGSEKAKEVLSEVYNVDLINIPSLRLKQYLELSTVVAANETKWLNEICSSAINEANKERGTLIICETIEHTKLIADKLKSEYRAGAIKLYTMNNMNQEREIEKVNPGEIIIATNLAGRGTDIKTDEIEKNGGMHVIVTFMPSNQRVEEQAFGRTARQGKRGTGQMILNAVNLMEYGEFIPQAVKELRNSFEAKILDEFQKKELKVIEIKDKLFNKFCSLLNKIRQDIREKSGAWKQFKDSVKDIVTNVMPSVYETNLLSAIEEQWSMFLRKIDDGTIQIEYAEKEYEKFNIQIEKDYENKNVIKNPYYHIAIANDLVINDSSLDDKYNQAMDHFDQAIKLDEHYSAAAFAGKAWLLLKGKEKFWTANDQSINYKQQAIIEFDKALAVLNDEMASLNAMQSILQQNHTDIKSDLSKQLIQKVNILGSYSSSLQNAVSTIKKSQRLIDITGIRNYQNKDEYIERGSGDNVTYEKCTDYNTEISKVTTSYYGIERNSEGKINQELSYYDEFELVFNDLTVREDSGTIDQAIDTISRAFSNHDESSYNMVNKLYQKTKNLVTGSSILDSKKYKNISINLKQINAERLQSMLNPDIKIKEATKEVAIAQLNSIAVAQFDNKTSWYRTIACESFFYKHLLPNSWSPDSCQVNLEIILDNVELETQKDLSIREVITTIQNKKDDNLRYNLTFINVNEISKSLGKEVLPNSSLNIEFPGLDSSAAKNKLSEIKSKNFSLEITGNKEELLTAINHPKIKNVEFFNSEKNIAETLYVHEAKEKISQIKESSFSIKLENLDNSTVNKIIDLCQNASFSINFITINPEASLRGLSEGQINVSFNNLGEIEATKLIPNLRKENMDFSLVFRHLKTKQVEGIIKKASLDQENIEISKVKTLNELFMDETKPILELSEFAARGIEYLLEINEKRFIPWRSVIAVGVLAGIQMAAGGVLIATGFGATVGMGLITEGAADIFTAYRAYSTRQFTWSDYMKQKAVSLVISAACMGWQAVKDAGKGVKNLAVGVGEEVLEQAGTRVVTNGKTIGNTLVQSGKNLKSLAFKQMGVATGEAAMREGLNKVADSLSHFALEQFKPQISLSIQNKVNTKFCQSNLMSLVRKIYALDSISKSQNLRGKIDRIVAETINPEHNFWRRQWDSIGGPLCKGILSDQKYLGSPFSMGIRILGTLNGMHQIVFIIDNVHDQLVKKLSQIDKETLQIAQLLHKYCQIEQKDAREIVEILKKEDIIQIEEGYNTTSLDQAWHLVSNVTLKELNSLTFYHEYINPLTFETNTEEYRSYKMPKTSLDKVNFGNHNQHKSKILNFCKSLHEGTLSVQISDLSQIMKSVSDVITEQIIRITEGQLISPWSSYGMGALTATISNSIQDKIIKNQLSDEIKSTEEELKRLEQKENKTSEDLNKITELRADINEKHNLSNTSQTYSGLINYEAKKYTIAYSQCENIHYAQQKDKNNAYYNKVVSKEVKNHADAVKKDKAADLAEMFTMATDNSIDLKIVDDPNYQLTEEDKAKNTIVVVFTKGDKDDEGKDDIGHYQLLGSDGKLIAIESNSNDCGYAVFAQLTGKSVEQLRNETAQSVEANSESFSKAIDAQVWVRDHYPQEVNSLLFIGGGSYLNKEKINYDEFRKYISTEFATSPLQYQDIDIEDIKAQFGEGNYSTSIDFGHGSRNNWKAHYWNEKHSYMSVKLYKNGLFLKEYKFEFGTLGGIELGTIGSHIHKQELMCKVIEKLANNNTLPNSLNVFLLKKFADISTKDEFIKKYNENTIANRNNIANSYCDNVKPIIDNLIINNMVRLVPIPEPLKVLYKMISHGKSLLKSVDSITKSKNVMSWLISLSNLYLNAKGIENQIIQLNNSLQNNINYNQNNESIKCSKDSLFLAREIYQNGYKEMEKEGFKILETVPSEITAKYGLKGAFVQKGDTIYIPTEGTNVGAPEGVAQMETNFLIATGQYNEKAIDVYSHWIEQTIKKYNISSSNIVGVGHSQGGHTIIAAAAKTGNLIQNVITFDAPGMTEEMINQYGVPKSNVVNFKSSIIGATNYNSGYSNIINVEMDVSPITRNICEAIHSNGNELVKLFSIAAMIKAQHSIDNISKVLEKSLAGFSLYGKEKEIGWINRYFGKYTLGALSYILSLRINDLQIRSKNIRVLSGIFINQVENNISDLIAKISESNEETVFVPLNLYNKHATGLIFEKLYEGSNQIVEIKYFDPLNKPIPEKLKELIAISLRQEIVNFKQITVDEQNYANCGPEVIENFVLYLTGQRLSQEKAIELHSKLVENELIGKANHGTHLLFEETKVLNPLDNVAVINNLPTVIANTQFLLTNNINEELHVNQNQIDELKSKHFVTPSYPMTLDALDTNSQEIRNTKNSKDSEQILLIDSSKQPAIEHYEEELHQDREDVIKLDQIIPLEELLESNFSNSFVVDNFINANENREELTSKSEIVNSGQKEIDLVIIETEKLAEANFNIPLRGYSEEDERDIEIAKADELIYQGDYQRAFPVYKKYASEWQEDLGTIEDWLIDQQERGIVINKITKDTLSSDLATKLEEICNFYAEQIMNNRENLEQAQTAWVNGFYMEAVNIYMTLCNQSDREMITKLDRFKKIIPERNNIPELNEPDNIYKVITQLEQAFIFSSAIGLYENTDYYEHQNEFLAGDHIEYITVS
jgi:hypothetical protein